MFGKNRNKKWKTKDFWKGIFVHNLSIKILSVVGAILVWLLIVNVDNPYKTKTFVVQVETENEDALRSVNKVYEVISGSTASVNVTGKRSVVDNLDSNDIRAVADLSELSAVNSVAIKVSLKNNTSDVVLECDQVMKVSLEDMETKLMKITVETTGTAADGYMVGECRAKPNVIEVTGGESVIDRIATVRVLMNVNGASETFSKKLEPVAYDKKGNKVTSSTLSFSSDTVKVQAKMLQSKEVPIEVKVTGVPAEGYEYVETTCLPETIEIAGSEKKLSAISEITLPIDITGMTDHSSRLNQEISISDYLDQGITLANDDDSVSVSIVIESLKERQISFSVDDIRFKELPDGYTAKIAEKKSSVSIVIRARESVLSEIDDTDSLGYLDCSEVEEGTYSLPLKLELDEDYTVLSQVKVKVKITKEDDSAEEEETAEETPSSTVKPTQDAQTQEPAATQAVETTEPKETEESDEE
ncbi:MAG: hypothetical protein LUH14_12430 [Clostridiaceae bacterium]|nr:hypothetical protein [Clostridiaceae bacterium]